MKFLKFFLIFIPISIALDFLHFNPSLIFFASCLAILPLAGLMGEATECISTYSGPKIGGFLNATFGNATELIISFFALKAGLFDVVKASIAGSVLGNILLVLGASMFFGGIKHKTQHFNINVVEATSSMFLFSIIGLCIPAVFTHSLSPRLLTSAKYEKLSVAIACLMLLVYILSLYFSFYTHKDLFGSDHSEDLDAHWSFNKSIVILILSTVVSRLSRGNHFPFLA